MITHCSKCNKALTKDLFKINKRRKGIPKGSFQLRDKSVHNNNYEDSGIKGYQRTIIDPKYIIVNKDDILEGVRSECLSGQGCCDHDGTELKCDCGQNIGEQYFDCWQGKPLMFFYENKVILKNFKKPTLYCDDCIYIKPEQGLNARCTKINKELGYHDWWIARCITDYND